MRAERAIRNLGKLRKWDRGARLDRAKLRLSLRVEYARDKFHLGADRWRISRALAAQILPPFLVSSAMFAAAEAGALFIRGLGFEMPAQFVNRLESDTYESLVSAGVGAIATFLGLYYATVGVVASTVYGSVAPGIRTLFVQEPNGVVYVRGVAYALVYGLLLLAAGSFGYRPSPVTLGVFLVLAVTGVLRLLILGGTIFNFFDPTALSAPLRNRFVTAAKMASETPASLNAGSQMTAHARARGVLDLYRQLAMLLEDRRARDASGPNRLTRQVLQLVSWYSTVKYRIPSESAWWGQLPDHPNWLTAGYLELSAALTTATGIRPKLAPDPLWVEEAAADILRRTLSSAFRARGSVGALGFADDIARVVNHLSARLQVDEALVLEKVWSGTLREITAARPAETDQLSAHQVAVNQLAAAEQAVMPMIEAWLGYVRAASNIASQDFSAVVRRALSNSANLYSSPLPSTTVKVLEEFARKLDLEVEAEGRRITPSWWLNHFAARSVAMQLKESHDSILESVDLRIEPIIQHFADERRQDLVAVAALSALELVHKLEVHQGQIRTAFDAMSLYRNPNTSVDFWPETPNDDEDVVRLRAVMHRYLAAALPSLRGPRFRKDTPDIYGQTYQLLLDATFTEIVQGDAVLGLDLFTSLFHEVSHVSARLRVDLADHNLDARVAYAAEPLVSLMELSGYACLMEQVNKIGIWSDVRALWDGLLAAGKAEEIAARHLIALEVAENHLGFNPGSMGRSMRSQRLREVLGERGIRGGRRRHDSSRPTTNPIIAVFAPGEHGGRDEIADLFVAEYLVAHLPSNARLSARAESAAEALRQERQAASKYSADPLKTNIDPTTPKNDEARDV